MPCDQHMCAYFLVLRWVPRGPERGVSDPTGIGIPLRSFSFLRSLFSLQGNWSRSALLRCTADRDLSETPPRHGRWSTTEARVRERGECGRSSAEGVPLGTGAVDALRWTPTVRVFSPLREKRAPTLHMHTPAESAQCTHARTTVHAARRGTYAVTCTCVACGAVALVSACE